MVYSIGITIYVIDNMSYFERLKECPQQKPYSVALLQQLNETSSTEKAEYTYIESRVGILQNMNKSTY